MLIIKKADQQPKPKLRSMVPGKIPEPAAPAQAPVPAPAPAPVPAPEPQAVEPVPMAQEPLPAVPPPADPGAMTPIQHSPPPIGEKMRSPEDTAFPTEAEPAPPEVPSLEGLEPRLQKVVSSLSEETPLDVLSKKYVENMCWLDKAFTEGNEEEKSRLNAETNDLMQSMWSTTIESKSGDKEKFDSQTVGEYLINAVKKSKLKQKEHGKTIEQNYEEEAYDLFNTLISGFFQAAWDEKLKVPGFTPYVLKMPKFLLMEDNPYYRFMGYVNHPDKISKEVHDKVDDQAAAMGLSQYKDHMEIMARKILEQYKLDAGWGPEGRIEAAKQWWIKKYKDVTGIDIKALTEKTWTVIKGVFDDIVKNHPEEAVKFGLATKSDEDLVSGKPSVMKKLYQGKDLFLNKEMLDPLSTGASLEKAKQALRSSGKAMSMHGNEENKPQYSQKDVAQKPGESVEEQARKRNVPINPMTTFRRKMPADVGSYADLSSLLAKTIGRQRADNYAEMKGYEDQLRLEPGNAALDDAQMMDVMLKHEKTRPFEDKTKLYFEDKQKVQGTLSDASKRWELIRPAVPGGSRGFVGDDKGPVDPKSPDAVRAAHEVAKRKSALTWLARNAIPDIGKASPERVIAEAIAEMPFEVGGAQASSFRNYELGIERARQNREKMDALAKELFHGDYDKFNHAVRVVIGKMIGLLSNDETYRRMVGDLKAQGFDVEAGDTWRRAFVESLRITRLSICSQRMEKTAELGQGVDKNNGLVIEYIIDELFGGDPVKGYIARMSCKGSDLRSVMESAKDKFPDHWEASRQTSLAPLVLGVRQEIDNFLSDTGNIEEMSREIRIPVSDVANASSRVASGMLQREGLSAYGQLGGKDSGLWDFLIYNPKGFGRSPILTDAEAETLYSLWKTSSPGAKKFVPNGQKEIISLKAKGYLAGASDIEFTDRGRKIISEIATREPSILEKSSEPPPYSKIKAMAIRRPRQSILTKSASSEDEAFNLRRAMVKEAGVWDYLASPFRDWWTQTKERTGDWWTEKMSTFGKAKELYRRVQREKNRILGDLQAAAQAANSRSGVSGTVLTKITGKLIGEINQFANLIGRVKAIPAPPMADPTIMYTSEAFKNFYDRLHASLVEVSMPNVLLYEKYKNHASPRPLAMPKGPEDVSFENEFKRLIGSINRRSSDAIPAGSPPGTAPAPIIPQAVVVDILTNYGGKKLVDAMTEAVSRVTGIEYVDNAASPITEFVLSKLNPELAKHSANLVAKGGERLVNQWNLFVDKLDSDLARNITTIMQKKFVRMFGGQAPQQASGHDRYMSD